MKNIFTLIEYTPGGNMSPSRCDMDCVNSDLKIYNWDDSEYNDIINFIGGKIFDHSITKDSYRLTLLINGIHVSDMVDADYDIHKYRNLELDQHGEFTQEQILHDQYITQFWQNVLNIKNIHKDEYDKKEAAKKVAIQLAKDKKHQLSILQAEELEKEQYRKLKLKFETTNV